MSKKKRLIFLLAVIAVVILIVQYRRHESESDPNRLKVSGNIEVRDAEISFTIAGRVLERVVSEGEMVKAGQVIAQLESDDLRAGVALRDAELRAAQASLAELEAGYRPEEIAQGKAMMQKAQAQLDELLAGSRPEEIAVAEAIVENESVKVAYLKIEFDRQTKLLKAEAISQSAFDCAKSEYESALATLRKGQEQLKLIQEGPRKEKIEQARATFLDAQQKYELLKKGPRQETIEQSRARVEQAVAARTLAEISLNYATIVAPFSGMLLSENIESGEYVVPGTAVVTLGDLENVWIRAYINETDLGRVKQGQAVRVSTDTYPGKIYNGRVSFISSSAEFTPKNVQTTKERVKLVYRIKIDIPNPKMELKPGMPADAEIVLGPGLKDERDSN
ncbi:MAG: efflux RND transporter periplasmic adaptor subunit [Lentisphaeria bacterium]